VTVEEGVVATISVSMTRSQMGGVGVAVAAVTITPEVEVSIQAHQGDLLLLVPEAKGERWQFYFNDASDGKDKAWAEGYATAQVRREQEENPDTPHQGAPVFSWVNAVARWRGSCLAEDGIRHPAAPDVRPRPPAVG
jgi:hypothetical protein